MSLPRRSFLRQAIIDGPIKSIRRFNSERLAIRILWIAAYIISIASFCFYIYGVFFKWYIDPDISITIRTIPSHLIPFPAITYCSPYIFSNKFANFTDFYMRLYLNETLPDYSQEERKYLASMAAMCNPSIVMAAKLFTNRTGFNVIKLINETRQNENLLGGYCGLDFFMYTCERMFNTVLTRHGLCYSFNMLGYNTIFNKKTLSTDFDFYKRKKIAKALYSSSRLFNQTVDDNNETIHWTLQNGYLDETVNLIPYRLTKRLLTLYFAFSSTDFFRCFDNYISVNFHLPNEIPYANMKIAVANFSLISGIQLEARSIKHSINMAGYSPEIRQCFFDGEKKLKYFNSYTKGNCDFECASNYTLKMCGCVLYHMVREQNTKLCDPLNVSCPSSAWRFIETYKAKIDEFSVPCNCLPPCNDIRYSLKKLTTTSVKSENPVVAVLKKYNYSIITVMDISLTDTEIEEHEYFISYTLQNFIADVGGLLGLFMGYSFLTVAELLQKLIKYWTERKIIIVEPARGTENHIV